MSKKSMKTVRRLTGNRAFSLVRLTTAPVIVDPPLPSDPALRGVIDDVLAKLRYSFAAAAAEEQPTASGRLDETFRSFLASRSAPSRSRFRKRGRALLDAPPPLRAAHLGRYVALKPEEYRTLGSDGMANRFGKLSVDSEALKNSIKRLRTRVAFVPKLPKESEVEQDMTDIGKKKFTMTFDPDLLGGILLKKMRLFIREVRCREETDEIGSDEINLGGTSTDPFGDTSLINEFKVSHDFDEDEVVTFGMSKVFTTWNLQTKASGFPYVYSAVIVMAEKDDGGFYAFLKALWEKIDDEVKAAVAGLVGASVGGAIGTVIPGIGNILGALAGFILGAFIGWVISWWDNPDDIVGVKTLMMTLASFRKSYYDWAKLTTPEGWKTTLFFKGDGGRYEVDCSFKVFAQ